MRSEVRHRLIKIVAVSKGRGWARLLWWGVLNEFDALFNIALQALRASCEELLLLFGHAIEEVDGLLSALGLYVVLTYPSIE